MLIYLFSADSLRAYLLDKFSRLNQIGIGCKDDEFIETADHESLKFLPLLFNEEVVDFVWPSSISLEKEYVVDVAVLHSFWKKLALRCPRLQKIVRKEFYENFEFDNIFSERALFLDSLMSMKHLQDVKLTKFWFHDTNLCTLAEQLPNLR